MTTFTELKFDPAKVDELVTSKKAALKANRGMSDLLGFGLGVISRRLTKDPQRYLDYGPYWWSLKALLSGNGYSYGAESDAELLAQYRGQNDTETMVMADQFRSEWLQTAQVGTSNFRLSLEGGDYTLYDADMGERPPR